MSEMIRREVSVPVPPEEVWEALVDADRNQSWMGGRLSFSELEPGAGLEFREDGGAAREGEVSVVRPGRYLRFRWWPAGEGEGEVSEVSYLVEPGPGGATRLTVQEQQVAAAPGWSARDEAGFRTWARSFALARA